MKRQPVKYRSSFTKRRENKEKKRLIITLLIGAFLLYFLFSWFLPAFIGGLSLLNRFKTEPTKETPVAENATLAPPVLNIPFEATSTATIKIGGYSLPNTTVEIYVDDDLKTTAPTGGDGSFTADSIPLNLGTNNISGKTVDDKGNKSFSSKPIQIAYDNEKPKLDLTSPQDNQTIKGGDKKVVVSGTTDSDKDITITANGIRLIVNTDGSFSQSIDINDRGNTIVVVATDTAGNTTQITRAVTYQAS
ncbi:MAG: hypothetical protein M1142_00455 [Patescibacteria group bacterium]|nr:hypothetical protein [Patescibacteria group bacterium]